MTSWVVWEQARGRKAAKHAVERKEVKVWTRSQFFLDLQDPPNTDAFCRQSLRWIHRSLRLQTQDQLEDKLNVGHMLSLKLSSDKWVATPPSGLCRPV